MGKVLRTNVFSALTLYLYFVLVAACGGTSCISFSDRGTPGSKVLCVIVHVFSWPAARIYDERCGVGRRDGFEMFIVDYNSVKCA